MSKKLLEPRCAVDDAEGPLETVQPITMTSSSRPTTPTLLVESDHTSVNQPNPVALNTVDPAQEPSSAVDKPGEKGMRLYKNQRSIGDLDCLF